MPVRAGGASAEWIFTPAKPQLGESAFKTKPHRSLSASAATRAAAYAVIDAV